jgi:hypothetical protein
MNMPEPWAPDDQTFSVFYSKISVPRPFEKTTQFSVFKVSDSEGDEEAVFSTWALIQDAESEYDSE